MSLERQLADRALERHPARSAAVLDRLPTEETTRLLEHASAERIAPVLRRLSPPAAAAALERIRPAQAAAVLRRFESGEAALLLRRVDESTREAALAEMPEPVARGIRSLLRFPVESAGGLADPNSLALPEDWTGGEVMAAIRRSAEQTRYNLYVVDRSQRLVGVLNLRELMMMPEDTRLAEAMHPAPLCIRADADLAAVIHHPAWLKVHALPVVDEQGVYVGAIRYKTLRALERRDETRSGDVDAARALGELFATAAGGLLDAIVGSTPGHPGGRSRG